VVADFVHISPNAALAGNVKVGEGTQVGIGACVMQNITIGKWATIGAGAVIIRDVPDYAVVVGNPGRIVRMNQL
jgi:acetyltransferase EpsM